MLGLSKAGAGSRYLRAIKRLREILSQIPGFEAFWPGRRPVTCAVDGELEPTGGASMSDSESRSGLVLELAEEFLERYRQGQRPPLKEYIDRHPELADEIREVFPAMAMMENIALADESLDGDAAGAAPSRAAPALRSSSATTASSARSAAAAWASSTRPSRSRSAGTWR